MSSLLKDIEHIYIAAGESADGELCSVAPSPELADKIKQELEQLRSSASPLVARGLKIQDQTRVGFNDGLIVPGDALPLGTSPARARGFALERAPLRGDLRVIVVLVDFSDKHMTQTKQHYQDLFFSTGVVTHGSVKEYYKEVTGGLVNITGEVVGPFRLPKTLAAYAHGASGTGNSTPNAQTMARDAANAANSTVNFGLYDNDGNGFVDAFIVVHAGAGGEVTGNTGDIWSHKWVIEGGALNADGTKIFAYLTVPEDAKLGVCAHELGHLLFGFPDLYDTDYSSEGVGNWCLMGGGSWNGGGDIPAHPSAWCKTNQGWVSTINQTNNATVSINDVRTSKSVYRMWKDGAASQEYFLVENRQLGGYDAKLPGPGLCIWHIDDSIGANSNEVHPRVKLLQADGLDQLKTGANRGDAGDTYPGSKNNRSFNATSNPNSNSYAGAATCVAVTSIGDSGPSMSARLSVKCKTTTKEIVKEKEISKETAKEVSKELRKETKEFLKERKETKEIEKPINDKLAVPEKGLVERPGGGLGGGGFGRSVQSSEGGAGSDHAASHSIAELQARLEQLEHALSVLTPFIGGELRPDLTRGALSGEADADRDTRAGEGDASAKRSLDNKPAEG